MSEGLVFQLIAASSPDERSDIRDHSNNTPDIASNYGDSALNSGNPVAKPHGANSELNALSP